MDDIHAPTMSSGPTSNGYSNGVPKKHMSLMELIAEKDRVESELLALASVLESHGVNMNTSLTTLDGYPRDDLDIAQIRTTRARIIHLRNDHRQLMGRIEAGLHEHHASAATPRQAESTSSSREDSSNISSFEAPFAKVNTVVPGSPAETAGLKAGDSIISFGNANWMNHEKLSKVAEVVSQNEGRAIPVKISRSNPPQRIELQLTPHRDWGGRGLLGCHLLPI
ncbi:26S proteasome non-ATPase-like protein regulatory subunit 9 [Patellaria atrata CBS 101060]|uniref:Probable 26S proteasome regulatory subunit p27 n=1 Tax=Patellaria atrata CBS 101060 TaxID=1346257 RepID=A0A9P4SAZ0_9PEZI|nr:26S proteasome non-ATPase-like protein regulatory subunit 9 [Patellaria atrata CBS 101060]